MGIGKPTAAQIDAVLKHLPLLQQPGLVASKEHSATERNEIITLGWVELSPEVGRLLDDLYEKDFVVDFDWGKWQPTAERYFNEPSRLQRASISTLQKLLTTHARKDRFCDGHFAAMVKCGHIGAILERLKEIKDKMA